MTQPVEGGAATTTTTTPVEGAAATAAAEAAASENEPLEAPAASNWWQFGTKEDAESWANNLVTKRLTRERKTNVEPLQQTNATLEAEVNRLKPLADKAMTADEKRDAEIAAAQQELEELRSFKTQTTRKAQIEEIASEVGLPANMIQFIAADGDADSVRASAEALLNALSEGGSTPGKRTPASKTPQGEAAAASTTAATGGGGNGEDVSDEEMVKRIRERTAEIRKNGGFSIQR